MLTPCRLGRLFCEVRCSRHAGSVAAHCSKAAMFASARPPCRQSTRAVSRHLSSHKHNNWNNWYLTPLITPNSISTGRLCGDVFASESAAKSIPARTVMPMTFCNVSNADGHANDLLQQKQRGRPCQETTGTFAATAPPQTPQSPRAICCQSLKYQSAS